MSDKRRVFLEEELGSVLKQGHRENDTLLELMRKFWDGRQYIRSGTKDPTKVTDGHVSMVGHCTPADLQVHLGEADKANGTANRILWFFGVRSKILPRGGNVLALLRDFREGVLEELRQAIAFGGRVKEIRRAPEIEVRWESLYRSLNDVPPGRLGAFFVRGPVMVMRMAAIFALADRSAVIRPPTWTPPRRSGSTRPGRSGSSSARMRTRAERLLAALKANPAGLTKTQIISDVFSRNLDGESVDELLIRLLAYRHIVRAEPIRGTRGRPAARYLLNAW